jgi:hypothetical protein
MRRKTDYNKKSKAKAVGKFKAWLSYKQLQKLDLGWE